MTDKNNNSGDYNSGDYNSGNRNSGYCNSGYCNSGNRNSGNHNSGYCNSGNHNSGNHNSGYYNSGYYNSGNHNSGNHNSGYYNSGYYNSGDYNSGFFNTDEPTIRLFNKDTGKKRSELNMPYLYLPITKWIPDTKMTDEQKREDPQFHVKGGTLITQSYHDAWREAWAAASKVVRDQFLALPNFDADIFLEITGVDVRATAPQQTCAGKIVEIDGRKYKLTEV